jgi:hypothetical protein
VHNGFITSIILLMSSIDILIGQRLQDVILEPMKSWVFVFNSENALRVDSPWRITKENKIMCTDSDHGQLFGLAKPVDAQVDAKLLLNGEIRSAVIGAVSDLALTFSSGARLEIFNHSGGYEGWSFSSSDGSNVIGLGGGDVAFFRRK